MDFRDVAAKETSGLIARLFARSSENSRKQIQSLRAALEAAIEAVEATLEAHPGAELEKAKLVEQLTKAAAAAAQQAAARATEEGQKAIEALRAEIADDVNTIAALSGSLEDAQAQIASLQAELEARRSDLTTERAKLEAERKQVAGARRELSEAREAQKQVDAARQKAEAARDAEARARASVEAERTELKQALDKARGELAKASKQIEAAIADRRKLEEVVKAAQTQVQAAEAKTGAVASQLNASVARVKALERAHEDHTRIVQDLEAKLKASTSDEMASLSVFDELVGGFEALAGATSVGDLLTTLIEQLAAEFSRVALFRVKGNRLEGEHQIGFDLPNDIAKVVLPLAVDSLLTRAASSGKVIRLSGRELTANSRAPFAGTPTSALALPIVVNGETLAVVYADDSEAQPASRASVEMSVRFATALQQHAVALLTRLTAELRALAELRQYAQSLIDEMHRMYDADVAAGHKGPAMANRLKDNVEFARSLYANRVTFEGPEAAALLDEQIAAMMKAPDTPFSRDLAAALQHGDTKASAKRSKLGA